VSARAERPERFERIVVGYAGDAAGRDGLVLAAALAEACAGQLTIVFPYHPLLSTVSGELAEARARREAGALLGPNPLLEDARWHWSNSSWPISALHELAAFEAAQLLVFGAAPERLEHRHVALMERMVHGAPCAVAVAPAGYAERPVRSLSRIGVGFADTPEGHAALQLGCSLTREWGGRDTRVIAGCGLSPALLSYASLSPSPAEVEEELHRQTLAALDQARERLGGEPLQLDVRRGDPCRVLSEAARELDLLILGSRGYGPVRHALLGGVSAEVMRAARCPVLVLPRPSAGQAAGAPGVPVGF
jgi:nucleotide-binding universal stress UspA family protein